MVVDAKSEARVYAGTLYPLELLQGKYSVLRDEMLWHEYDKSRTIGTNQAKREAVQILQAIREAPD